MTILLAVVATLAAESLSFENRRYRYELYRPSTEPAPVILLLHGAGGAGRDMLDLWKPLARSKGIALVAPDLPRELSFEAIAPAFFRGLLDKIPGVDKQRVYVFGDSMGGYLAYDAAMFGSDYFAGAAVYANFISPEYVGILNEAKQRIPIAIYAGAKDELIPISRVRTTRDLLESRGFPMHYLEFPRNGHDYGAVADRVNADAWAFFERIKLP